MRTIKLTISYDGTGYCGWQRQHNGASIQQELERAAGVICDQPIVVHGAGRTDAGVHAEGMTAHFKTTSAIESRQLLKGINALLPKAIRVLAAEEHPSTFHARFSALAKTYQYSFFTGPIQSPLTRLYIAAIPFSVAESVMRDALQRIVGTHDFSSFETAGSRDKAMCSGRGAVRTIFRADLIHAGNDTYQVVITGDGFLRHMVRNIVGTVIDVGRGKRSLDEFKALFDARDRNCAGATAPAHGLTLLRVHYERDWD